MTKSKINSVKVGKYIFQPTKYDDNGNIYCTLFRTRCNNKFKTCKVTGLYNFVKEKFELIFVSEGWMTNNHKKLLKFMLNEYDWTL